MTAQVGPPDPDNKISSAIPPYASCSSSPTEKRPGQRCGTGKVAYRHNQHRLSRASVSRHPGIRLMIARQALRQVNSSKRCPSGKWVLNSLQQIFLTVIGAMILYITHRTRTMNGGEEDEEEIRQGWIPDAPRAASGPAKSWLSGWDFPIKDAVQGLMDPVACSHNPTALSDHHLRSFG